jgi:hypothetical protein
VRDQFTEGLQVTSIPKPLVISLLSDSYVISGGIHAEVIGTSHDTKCHKYRVSFLVFSNSISFQKFFIKGVKIKISYEACL